MSDDASLAGKARRSPNSGGRSSLPTQKPKSSRPTPWSCSTTRNTLPVRHRNLDEGLWLSPRKSYSLALQIHVEGRAIAWSGRREVAELKRDQMRSGRPGFLSRRRRSTFPWR